MKFKLIAVLMATLLVACGGGNTTSPSSYEPTANTPTPTPGPTPVPTPTPSSVPVGNGTRYCLVNDLAEAVLAAKANVTLFSGETTEIVTDENACVTVPSGGVLNYIDSPGFRRLTDFPSVREDVALAQGTFALWPVGGYIEQLEEYDGTYSQIGTPFGGIRPKSGVYTVSLPSEMTNGSTADLSVYEAALNILLLDAGSQASNKVVFTTTTSSSANIKIVVEAGMSWAGYFDPTISGRYITGGTLRIRSLDALINDPEVVRHELGHFLGVNHDLGNPNRLMYRGAPDNGYATDAEVVHFRMRFLRSPGFDARKG